ncbi:hypothetical protein BV20DRAFT_862942 [Pilatotrama ljubarskyi]|nr:hypothetical protein BV20DRAFT_862942 [Pilatotrama ljubarskyi]
MATGTNADFLNGLNALLASVPTLEEKMFTAKNDAADAQVDFGQGGKAELKKLNYTKSGNRMITYSLRVLVNGTRAGDSVSLYVIQPLEDAAVNRRAIAYGIRHFIETPGIFTYDVNAPDFIEE